MSEIVEPCVNTSIWSLPLLPLLSSPSSNLPPYEASHARIGSPLPSLPRSILHHLHRWLITGLRHRVGVLAEWVATLGRFAAASLVDMFRDHQLAEPTQHFCSSCYRTLGSGQVMG